jgi:hypothetical protein
MRGRLARLTYANVMSSIAVFVVMGGGAYAATTVAKNSVGTSQLKANAVNAAKVKDGSLLAKDFKAGQLPAGPQGQAGATGPAGATGAAGAAGAAGAKGDPGDPTAPAVSGDTYAGQLSVILPVAQSFVVTGATFPRPLPVGVATPSADYRAGAAPDANCPAIGTAATAGVICIYGYSTNSVSSADLSGGSGGLNKRFGFSLDVFRTGVTSGWFIASWAYKVP